MKTKLYHGNNEFQVNKYAIVAIKWVGSNQTYVKLSHASSAETSRKKWTAPSAIADYNWFMEGVDIAHQTAAVYYINRKPSKWRKKVFFKTLMLAVVNA